MLVLCSVRIAPVMLDRTLRVLEELSIIWGVGFLKPGRVMRALSSKSFR